MNTVNFSELGITAQGSGFVGNRIDITEILNQEIIVHDFKIGPSKFPKPNRPDRMDLQIEIDNVKRITWSGSGPLIEMIQKVPKGSFPFKTTIKKEKDSKRLLFT